MTTLITPSAKPVLRSISCQEFHGVIDSRELSRYSSRRVLQGLLFEVDVVKGGFLELDAIRWDTGEVDTLEVRVALGQTLPDSGGAIWKAFL